jgi:ribosomal protein L18
MSSISRKQQTQKRHRRLRRQLTGTSSRPRLAVFRSNNHIYAQVIDDDAQNTSVRLRPSTRTCAPTSTPALPVMPPWR